MEHFFKKQTPSSRIKANIVAEYFPQYCKILLTHKQNKIRYLDLFAGPGIYGDNSDSTPILLAKTCESNSLLAEKVELIFNDNTHINELKENFTKNLNEKNYKHPPIFLNETVGESPLIDSYLISDIITPNPHPTLLFFDPWGYRTINTLVLSRFLEHWGNEIFLFVNIKRINAAIDNDKFEELMISLFPTSIDKLRKDRKYKARVHERLSLIMENLANEFSLASKNRLYNCAFKFQEEDSIATSHFIIHFTKHPKGYELVKQVYYDFDNIGATLDKDGNYTFDSKKMDANQQDSLSFTDQNIEYLSRLIEKDFKGKTLTARALFDQHHTETKLCGSHYANTLRHMVENGKIIPSFNDNIKHKVSVLINDNCILKFN